MAVGGLLPCDGYETAQGESGPQAQPDVVFSPASSQEDKLHWAGVLVNQNCAPPPHPVIPLLSDQ